PAASASTRRCAAKSSLHARDSTPSAVEKRAEFAYHAHGNAVYSPRWSVGPVTGDRPEPIFIAVAPTINPQEGELWLLPRKLQRNPRRSQPRRPAQRSPQPRSQRRKPRRRKRHRKKQRRKPV